jgi:trans-2,3-dihydro-3-hydroxyanthranilate isomerase
MQRLAREFNFSKTTFVPPPRDPSHTCRVRIFTLYQELPFAGHPTVGTAAVLASLGGGDISERQFVFEEGIGPVTVTVEGQAIRLHLNSPKYETTGEAPPAAAISSALALPEHAIVESWYAGVGLRFCFVRLTDPELVDHAVLDGAAWEAGIADSWSPYLYVFAGDHRDRAHLRPLLRASGRRRRGSRHRVGMRLIDRRPRPAVSWAGRHLPHPDRPGSGHGRPSALEGTGHKQAGRLTEVVVSGR